MWLSAEAISVTSFVTSGRVEQGQLHLHQKKPYDAWLAKHDSRIILAKFEPQHAKASPQQYAYYWAGVLAPLWSVTHCSTGDLHEFFKRRFNPRVIALVSTTGEILDQELIGNSTSTLNKVTFGEYLKQIRTYASDRLQVVIPDPQ
jgi:hypothetical protein